MTNYQLIMTLLLKGDSYRSIQAQCGAAHVTIAKARKVLDEHNFTTEAQVLGIRNDELTVLVGDNRLTHSSAYVTIDFDAAIKARTGRLKTPLNIFVGAVFEYSRGARECLMVCV